LILGAAIGYQKIEYKASVKYDKYTYSNRIKANSVLLKLNGEYAITNPISVGVDAVILRGDGLNGSINDTTNGEQFKLYARYEINEKIAVKLYGETGEIRQDFNNLKFKRKLSGAGVNVIFTL
jgi:hypothetical protein